MATASKVQIEMPAMGESVTEGTVIEWHKSVGDEVSEGETVVEVSTDKVDAEVPAPASGVLSAIHVDVDGEVKVGAALGEIDPNGAAEGGNGAPKGAPAEASDEVAQAPDEVVPEGGTGPAGDVAEGEASGGVIQVLMPEMGESVTEGTVLEWHVEEGGEINEGDTLVEVSTDKVDAEVPATATGTVTKIFKQADEVIQVGEALAEITAGAGAAPRAAPPPSGNGAAAAAPAAPATDGTLSTPIARRAAAEAGVDLGSVDGTGVGGKVTKADVLAAAERGPAADSAGEAKPLRGPAKMLAEAMEQSLQIPTATSFRTLAVDTLDAKRRALNGALTERGIKVSFTHLIAWAIVQAAKDWPVMGRSFETREGKPHAVVPEHVNLGIAVDIEKKDGSRALMVPCIKAADTLDFPGFHSYYEELITKTRENTLTADDFKGTNISLTNPGGLGTVASVPRLMSGQGTIIATGSIAHPVEYSHLTPERIQALGVSKVMTMTSTYDHRVIQGAESGSFLRAIDELLTSDAFYEDVAEQLDIPAKVVAAASAAAAAVPSVAVTAEAPPALAAEMPSSELLQAVQAATSLLKAYRTHGHLAANLDPLGGEPKGDPALDPKNLDLTPELMDQIPASILRIGVAGETLLDALPRMRDAYCGTIGYQIEHLSSHQQRVWLREMIETGTHREEMSNQERRGLLSRLIEVHSFERFIQKAYLGQKMFSIEGLDVIVPMIDEVATIARRGGAEEVVLGMAHRGRLAVLAHNLGRSIESIMAEFEGAKVMDAVKRSDALRHGGTGDVKYHHGAEGVLETPEGEIRMHLYPNPSHLEFVGPVATGAARAVQTEHSGPKLHHRPEKAVPLLLHGDAAFPGQGVVAETLNMQALSGYETGGTIHLVTNNQVGFTTDPVDSRSTPYASDMAKGFNVPVILVNADDVEAAMSAIRLAMAYREKWGRDVVIDVIGYRRYGHNETDEPAYTQPEIAAKIKKHQPVSELYSEQLKGEGVVSDEDISSTAEERNDELSVVHKALKAKIERGEFEDPTATGTGELDRTRSPEVETAVSEGRVRDLNEQLMRFPESFTVHRKLRKPLFKRLEILDEGPIEFGHAESLAFASLLTEGTHLRLTGQDTERGTFSHRHLVLHDEKTGLAYSPIQNLSGALAPFEIHNSPLSENSCLGFEYGYSAASPDSLVLWEAQFGDFGNGAQVIIDSFIVSAESKWGQRSRLTLLLPHGYEGSGPEHSSARIERFLQLAAEGNIRLANPTTAAQYFHLLRRQARIAKPRPLVVFTPKGLLRLEAAASKLSDLTSGQFKFVLDDERAEGREQEIDRLVLCSGRVFYDIDGHDRRADTGNVAVVRVELLYPFAREQIAETIARYPNLKQIIWCQEEPQNMGAWSVMFRRLPGLVPEGVEFGYVGRPGRASPSEGYPAAHRVEQERIVLTALTG